MFPYIPNTTISLYSMMIGLGAALGILVSVLRLPKSPFGASFSHISNYSVSTISRPLTRLHLLLGALYTLALGLLGAKLFFVVGNIEKVIANEMTLLQLFASGFMFYGGFFGGIVGVAIYCKLFKFKMIKFFDALAGGLALGQAFGRIGCYFAGCCYGVPTNSIIGIVFTNPAHTSVPIGVPLVPVQLIESALCFCIFIFLLVYGSKQRKDGMLFSFYCLLYAIGRFIIEFWRGDEVRGFVGLLSWSQFISLLILLSLGVICLIRFLKNRYATKKDMNKQFLEN